MNGIYLTQEGKQEIEAKIAELEIDLENHIQHCKMNGSRYDYQFEQGIEFYKEILSSATILPVYESLGHAMQNNGLQSPNGVIIIQSKQTI